jgi:LCCL domain
MHRAAFTQNIVRQIAVLVAASLSVAASIDSVAAEPNGDAKPPAVESVPIPREANLRDRLSLHCSDGSVLKVYLLDAQIPLKTDYGVLQIPAADVRRIDFATRTPAAFAQRVQAAVERLGSDDYHTREEATAQLLALQQIAYPALVAACENPDPEIVHRAEQLLAQIRKSVPQDDLDFQEGDVVYTDKSQIAGNIELESLHVESVSLGEQQLKLMMLRRLEVGGEGQTNALPDPGNLINYQNQVGKTLYFQLTASPANFRGGFVWGTDVYTLDSTLWLAAMHAGLLQSGQSKVVGVTILGPQANFTGSRRNNITSGDWANYPGGFRFKTGRANGPAPRAQAMPAPNAPQFNPGFVQPGFAP